MGYGLSLVRSYQATETSVGLAAMPRYAVSRSATSCRAFLVRSLHDTLRGVDFALLKVRLTALVADPGPGLSRTIGDSRCDQYEKGRSSASSVHDSGRSSLSSPCP